MKKIVLVIVVFLTTYGGFLRFHNLGEQSYWMDEGYTINAILSIQEKGESILDSGKRYACPHLYCYPTAWIATYTNSNPTDNPATYRILAALAGTLLIPLIFFTVKNMVTAPIAIGATALTALSTIHIAWARQARWYTLFALFFWLALYFFYNALYGDRSRRIYYWVGTLIATLGAMITHDLGYLLPLFFLLWFATYLLRSHTYLLQEKPLYIGVFSFVFFLVTAIALAKISPWVSSIAWHDYGSYFLTFYALSYAPLIPFMFVGIGFVVATYHTQSKVLVRPLMFITAVTLIYAIPIMYVGNIVHYRYLFHLTPVLFIITALGAMVILKHFKNDFLIIPVLALILLTSSWWGSHTLIPRSFYVLESDLPSELSVLARTYFSYTPQPNWNAAYAYIKSKKKSGDIIISSHPQFNKIFLGEAGYWVAYDYLNADQKPAMYADKEYYVAARVIDNLAELKKITTEQNGFMVFDLMAADGRIKIALLEYIEEVATLVFHERTNEVSELWVFEF